MVDCKQSGFFSSDLVEDSACASSRRAAREAREAAREENTHAFSHTRGHFRVSRVSLDGLRKKRDCS